MIQSVNRSLLLALLVCVLGVFADIQYHPTMEILPGSLASLWTSTLFSSHDAPSNTPPGNGRSFVEIDFKAQLPAIKPDNLPPTAKIQIGLLQGGDLSVLGDGTNTNFCCPASEPGTEAKCKPNEIFVPQKIQDELFVWARSVDVPLVGEESVYNIIAPIPTSGKYTLFVSHCDQTANVKVIVGGKSTWMNPYGYLPGHFYGYLPFYGILTIVYLLVCLGWMLNIIIFRSEIIRVHKFFSMILVLCVIEAGSCYYDYFLYNDRGNPFKGLMLTCVTTKVFHQTFSRAILVALSLGYGVTKLKLGEAKLPLNILSAAYLLVIMTKEFGFRQWSDANINMGIPMLILNFFAATLESIFLCWVFVSLKTTITQLKATRQDVKLTLYYKFMYVLIACAVAIVGFVVYVVVFRMFEYEAKQWDMWWFIDVGFWQLTYLTFLTAIAVLWRPSKISKRFEYEELAGGVEMHVQTSDMDSSVLDVNVEQPPQYVVSSDEELSDY